MEINQIIHGDCLEVMKDIPDKSVDLVVTSPPYNKGTHRLNGGHKKISYNSYNDNLDYGDYLDFIFKSIDELLRISKYHIFYNIQEGNSTNGLYYDIELKYRNTIKEIFYWIKRNPPSHIVDTQCSNAYEKVYCFSHDSPNLKKFSYCNFSNGNGDYMKNIIITNVNSENNGHGFAFPIFIPKFFINFFSKENDLILDPFSGSGTTAIACLETGRNYICIEKDKTYYDLSVKRVNDYKSQLKMEFTQ